jgi:zona occludens toxin (predicted ATPase)
VLLQNFSVLPGDALRTVKEKETKQRDSFFHSDIIVIFVMLLKKKKQTISEIIFRNPGKIGKHD